MLGWSAISNEIVPIRSYKGIIGVLEFIILNLFGIFRIDSLFPATEAPAPVIIAQYKIVKTQLPILYGCLIVNFATVAVMMYGSAPDYLAVIIPIIFGAIFIARLFYWAKQGVDRELSISEISREFRKSTILAWVLSLIISCWSCAIIYHSSLPQTVFVLCFLWASASTISVGLAYLPRAHFAIMMVSTIPFFFSAYTFGEPIIWAEIILFLTFNIIFLRFLKQHFRSFLVAETSKIKLEKQIEQTEVVHKEMEYLALTDALTDLPNRRAFFLEVDSQLASIKTGQPFVIGIMDLDGFKPINDVFGHNCGDFVLVEVGKRITKILGDRGQVTRLGGDEFGLIISKFTGNTGLLDIGKQISEALRCPYRFGSSKAMLSGSCGFVICSDAGEKLEALMEKADNALYEAKKSASKDVEIYSTDHHHALREQAVIEQALRSAIADDKIELNYQPIIDFSNGKITAFEALARWSDPIHGNIPPDKFIPIAEQTGLIVELTDLLFQKALKTAAAWPPEIGLSFNVSAIQLVRPGFGLSIISTLGRIGFLPSRLQIEITESALMSSFEQARKNVAELRHANIKVALDDFGTGFASFGYLDKVSVDKLKIDKRFVPHTGMANGKRQILKAIIGLSEGLGIPTIQEGIESAEQHNEAMNAGCCFGQGYLYSKPISSEQILKLLDGQNVAAVNA